MSTAIKVKPIALLKASLKDVKDNGKALLSLSWIIILLYFIKAVVLVFTDFSYQLQTWTNSFVTDQITSQIIIKIVFIVYQSLLFAVLSYALFQFFIEKRNISQAWSYKRGITQQKTLFTINCFFEINPKILLLFLGFFVIDTLFYLLEIVGNQFVNGLVDQAIQQNPYADFSHLFTIKISIGAMQFLVREVIYAALLLIWPAIALGQFTKKTVGKFIKPLKGNIIKIAFASIIIFSPFYIINSLYSLAIMMIGWAYGEIPNWATWSLYNYTYVFSYMLYTLSLIIYCSFISKLYTALKNKDKI